MQRAYRVAELRHASWHDYPIEESTIADQFPVIIEVCADGDPLDVLVFGQEPVQPLTVVDVRAIGVMQMRDALASYRAR